jgi:hypothetical protein
MTTDDVLFFLHVPKTGGTTLTGLLEEHFSEEQILRVPRTAWTEGFRDLPAQELAKIRLVAGHFWVGPGDNGVHDLLTADPVVITMLRSPIDRTLSGYRHIARSPRHPFHVQLREVGGSLVEFLRDLATTGYSRNVQARQVVGTTPGNPLEGTGDPARDEGRMSDDELLSRARERLDQFAFVGLQERFDDSLTLLSQTLGWEPLRANDRPHEAAGHFNISPEAEAEILRLTEVDRALYEHARRLFESRIADRP